MTHLSEPHSSLSPGTEVTQFEQEYVSRFLQETIGCEYSDCPADLAKRIFPGLVLPDVIEVLRGDNHYDARQMAYLVLSRIGGAEADDAIRQYIRHYTEAGDVVLDTFSGSGSTAPRGPLSARG